LPLDNHVNNNKTFQYHICKSLIPCLRQSNQAINIGEPMKATSLASLCAILLLMIICGSNPVKSIANGSSTIYPNTLGIVTVTPDTGIKRNTLTTFNM
jgi:hypothetical protein